MVRSMTGFGRSVYSFDHTQITVETRSVNHRFLEISLKFPKDLLTVEMKAKKLISSLLSRGKIDLHVSIKSLKASDKKIQINWPLVEAYEEAKQQISAKVNVQQWTMAEMLNIDQLLTIEEEEIPYEELEKFVLQAVKQAIEQLVEMREREGHELKQVMVQLQNELTQQLHIIQTHANDAVSKYRERLIERMVHIGQSEELDARILSEVAIFAEKADITEELDRMKSHITQMNDALNGSDTIGRKLEFIVQEMNREVNTIGSKNQSTTCSAAIIQSKMILEKLREQVQNIE